MSAKNGDKSRFHRERKQKIARRLRNQQIRKTSNEQGGAARSASRSGSKVASE